MQPNNSIYRDINGPLTGLNIKLIEKYKVIAQKQSIDQTLQKVLQKNAEDKSFEEIALVMDYLLTFKSILNIKQIYGQNIIYRLAQHGKYIMRPEAFLIQDKNGHPSNCYLVLEGKVIESSEVQHMKFNFNKMISNTGIRILGSGDLLFDQQVISEDICVSNYVTQTETKLLGFQSELFRSLIRLVKQVKQNIHNTNLWSQFPILNCLFDYDKAQLLMNIKLRTYGLNHRIVLQGEAANRVFFIKQGTIRIVQNLSKQSIKQQGLMQLMNPQIQQCKEQSIVLGRYFADEIFGYEELLQKIPIYEYSFYSDQEDTQLYEMPSQYLFTKFNLIFNLKQFLFLQQTSEYRITSRGRISSIHALSLNTTNQLEDFKTDITILDQVIEPENQRSYITSKKRPHVKNTILAPDDTEYQHGAVQTLRKQTHYGETDCFEMNKLRVFDHIESMIEKKRCKKKLSFQLQKMLLTNREFQRKIKQKKQVNYNLNEQIIQIRNNKLNMKSFLEQYKQNQTDPYLTIPEEQVSCNYEQSRIMQNLQSTSMQVAPLDYILPTVLIKSQRVSSCQEKPPLKKLIIR